MEEILAQELRIRLRNTVELFWKKHHTVPLPDQIGISLYCLLSYGVDLIHLTEEDPKEKMIAIIEKLPVQKRVRKNVGE